VKPTRHRAKKLLVASIGVGTLTFAACGAFPGCNLMAPPPCDPVSDQYGCHRDLGTPELGAPHQGTDLSVSDLTSGGHDGSSVD